MSIINFSSNCPWRGIKEASKPTKGWSIIEKWRTISYYFEQYQISKIYWSQYQGKDPLEKEKKQHDEGILPCHLKEAD